MVNNYLDFLSIRVRHASELLSKIITTFILYFLVDEGCIAQKAQVILLANDLKQELKDAVLLWSYIAPDFVSYTDSVQRAFQATFCSTHRTPGVTLKFCNTSCF